MPFIYNKVMTNLLPLFISIYVCELTHTLKGAFHLIRDSPFRMEFNCEFNKIFHFHGMYKWLEMDGEWVRTVTITHFERSEIPNAIVISNGQSYCLTVPLLLLSLVSYCFWYIQCVNCSRIKIAFLRLITLKSVPWILLMVCIESLIVQLMLFNMLWIVSLEMLSQQAHNIQI